jgi:hypothetical protein
MTTPSIGEYLPGTWLNIHTGFKGILGKDPIENPVLILSQEGKGRSKTARLIDQKGQLIFWATDIWGSPQGEILALPTRKHPLGFRFCPENCIQISPLSAPQNLEKAKKMRQAFLERRPDLSRSFFKDSDKGGLKSRI